MLVKSENGVTFLDDVLGIVNKVGKTITVPVKAVVDVVGGVVDVVAAPVKLLGKALSWVGGWFWERQEVELTIYYVFTVKQSFVNKFKFNHFYFPFPLLFSINS